jgi:NitT/TauT family transport system substrate-binding protein
MKEGPMLLVEDNPDDEKLTLRALKKNNIANRVVVARDGQDALDHLLDPGPFSRWYCSICAAHMKRILRFLVLLLAVATQAGCGVERALEVPLKLTIAEASQPSFALLYVADAKGFLKEAGLDVTFTRFRLGRDALRCVIDGNADLATVFETPVVARIFEGEDLAIISSLHSSSRNQVLLARRDRGISTISDIRGKRIGLSPGTSLQYLLTVMLETAALPVASVTQVSIAQEDYETSLVSGTVDGVMTVNPLPLSLLLGDRAVALYSDAYTETSMLVGRRDVVEAKREAMMRIAKALVKAQDHLESNPEESIAIVTARLAGVFDEAAVRERWKVLKLEAKLDNVLVSTMGLEGEWMKAAGRFSGAVPDFRRSVASDFLRSARREAVTLRETRDPK